MDERHLKFLFQAVLKYKIEKASYKTPLYVKFF